MSEWREEDSNKHLEFIDHALRSSGTEVDRDRLIGIWSKVKIAEILQKQAAELLDTAATDLEFYRLISAQKDL